MKQMLNRGEAGVLSTFIITLVVITASWIIYTTTLTSINDNYGTSNDVQSVDSLNSMSQVSNITSDLNNQFTGINATGTSGGVLGDSFNQVYTLGIITTRIVGTVTPAVFGDMLQSIGDATGIDPSLVQLATFTITLLLISGLLMVLLGRLL